MSLILGNSSSDLDSVVCAVALARAEGGKAFLNITREDLALRKDVGHLLEECGIADFLFVKDLPQYLGQGASLTLVDHNALAPHQRIFSPYVVRIIDHHMDEKEVYPNLQTKIIRKAGSCATLVAEVILAESKMTKELAYLLLAPILLDTADLKDERKTTDQDQAMVKKLETYLDRKFPYISLLEKRLDVTGLTPLELLQKDFKIYAGNYGIASLPRDVEWGEERLVDLQEFLAKEKLDFLIVLQWMGSKKQIILYTPFPYLEKRVLSVLTPFVEKRQGHFLTLKEPLARKELQPLVALTFRSS